MNIVKEKLIIAMIDHRIQNILNNSDEVNWMADVMNFGWTGFDRKDNDGNYEPSNCRWATDAEQRANKVRKVHGASQSSGNAQ